MNSTNETCPVYIDGQKIDEAPSVSYSISREHAYSNPHHENEPPSYEITAEFSSDIIPDVSSESRVEVAFPPSLHDGDAWRVLEVWEIYKIQIAPGRMDIGAYNGCLQDTVQYLGDDTAVAHDGELYAQDEVQALQNDDEFDVELHDT